MGNTIPDKAEKFIIWLNERLDQKGWSDYQLAIKADLSGSVISAARAGKPPKWEACIKIANALSLPPEVVFRAAGLLPPVPEDDLEKQELDVLFTNATPEQRRQILEFVHFLLRK